MKIRFKKNAFFREINNITYLIKLFPFCEVCLNSSASFFLQPIKKEFKDVKKIVEEISSVFCNTPKETIEKDFLDIIGQLLEIGFLETDKSQAIKQDKPFHQIIENDFFPKIKSDVRKTILKSLQTTPKLLKFQFELTSKCNERCIHCYIPHEEKLFNMPYEIFSSAIKQLSDLNALNIILSGGEPLSHPDIIKMLKEIQKHDFYITVLSNLTLLSDKIVNEFKKMNIHYIQTSLYSINPLIHDSITKLKGSCELTKQAILKLKKAQIEIRVSCPIMKRNVNDYLITKEWCTKNEVPFSIDYELSANFKDNNEINNTRLSIDEISLLLQKTLSQQTAETIKSHERDIVIQPENKICNAGFSSCCITPDGNIYPCPAWHGTILGNINEQTLEDIWTNSINIQKIRSYSRKDLSNGKCLNCEFSAYCVPCFAKNANESLSSSPLELCKYICELAKLRKNILKDYL